MENVPVSQNEHVHDKQGGLDAIVPYKERNVNGSSSDTSQVSKSNARSSHSVTSTVIEKELNNLISVTIKEQNVAKELTSINPEVIPKLKEEKPGPDEIYCIKEGYKLGKKIGEGAYSKVKAAEVLDDKIRNDRKIAKLVETNGHNMVAVKILNKTKAPSDYTTKFIGREIQALHRIRGHPNVVEIYDVFETNEYLFIITELCQKGDLLQYINSHIEVGHSGLSEVKARGFFIQICEGMKYCHERGVVHRDFKCDNVLICDDEKTVKITDFGFACTVPNKRLMLSTPCGSYSYAAPEVLFGKSYDPFLGDIWCLGVVLFCMLNGTTPYGHVQLSLLANHMKTQRLQFQKISQEAKILIRKLLQYDPRKRPRIQDILNSPWVNKEKVNIVERLYTPTVIDRSHLTPMVAKFNIPAAASQSTEHRQCINFSRICFGNGSESVLLKSRQPNRERDRYLLVRPVLRRTRMSVVEFKERLGLKINQTRPMAEILKNIISGNHSNRLGHGDMLEHKIPELPGNLSTIHGDSNQHMIEYLAEMWVDIDRDRGTTVTERTTCYTEGSDRENEASKNHQIDIKPNTAPAAIGQSHCINNTTDNKAEDETNPENEKVSEIQDSKVEGLHPPPGRECCCCGDDNITHDYDENGTEVSFCTCSNPDTLITGSTYTVHVPQPQNECPESPTPNMKSQMDSGFDTEEQVTYKKQLKQMTKHGKQDERHFHKSDANIANSSPASRFLRPGKGMNQCAEKGSYRRNVYLRPRIQGNCNVLKASQRNLNNYKMNIASVKMSVIKTNSDTEQPSENSTKQCFALLTNQAALNILEARLDQNYISKDQQTSKPLSYKVYSKMHERQIYKPDYYKSNRYEPYVRALLEREEGSILKYTSNPPSARDAQSDMESYCEKLSRISNKTYIVKNAGDTKPAYSVPEIFDITLDDKEVPKDIIADDSGEQNYSGDVLNASEQKQEVTVKATEPENYQEKPDSIEVANLPDANVTAEADANKSETNIVSTQQGPDETAMPTEEVTEVNEVNEAENNLILDVTDAVQLETCDSHDSLKSSVDEELEMVASIVDDDDEDDDDDDDDEKFIPRDETPYSPLETPEVKHVVSPVRLETKSVSPIKNEGYYYLRPRRTESEKAQHGVRNEIYEKHARATPVKTKYRSAEVAAEIKKSKKLLSKKALLTNKQLATNSGYTMDQLGKSPKKSTGQNGRISVNVANLMEKNEVDRENKSLPLLQVHRSKISRPIIYEDTRGRTLVQIREPRRSSRPRSRSPFPNPLSNPSLWHQSPDSLPHRTEVRATPSVTCPLLPQKRHNAKEVTKHKFRQRPTDADFYHVTKECIEKKNLLFPPVTNLALGENKKSLRNSMMGKLQKQY